MIAAVTQELPILRNTLQQVPRRGLLVEERILEVDLEIEEAPGWRVQDGQRLPDPLGELGLQVPQLDGRQRRDLVRQSILSQSPRASACSFYLQHAFPECMRWGLGRK
jgi:hypothetical protein